MSQEAPPELIDVGDLPEQRINTAASDPRDVPWKEPNQVSQGQANLNFTDSSGPLFNMYIKMAEEEDNKVADRWQKDADGILIFTGLFSAAIAALVAVSVQDLKPNSQDTSAFYLGKIFQLLADPNVSRESILAAQPPPFSPPKSAVWVNSFWFLSLVISLTCALLATLLQQWARRYVTITQPQRYSPHKRAPIRAFFANGVETFHLPWAVKALPALLHLSLFLFFSGLAVFLFNTHYTVFSAVIWWIGLAGGVYVFITLMPIFWHDSPYYAPLSSSAFLFYAGIQYAASRLVDFLWDHDYTFIPRMWPGKYRRRLFGGMTKTVQDTGSELSAEINSRILTWTIHALDEDKEVEQFFEAIPGFCGSDVVHDLERVFAKVDQTLAPAFSRFMSRTLSSSLVLEADRKRRVITCVKAVNIARLPRATMSIFGRVFGYGVEMLQSVDIGRSLRSSGDRGPNLCSQGIIAGVIASVTERDDRWMALAKDQLGVSEEVLQDYLAHGDSVLLANLIHITRPLFRLCLEDPPNMAYYLLFVLRCISKFDIENTLPGLQHDFCVLWNEIAREARRHEPHHHIPRWILRPIRHLYIALHQDTHAAPTAFDASTVNYDPVLFVSSSYPSCNIPSHHSDVTSETCSLPTQPATPFQVSASSLLPQSPPYCLSSH